VIWVATAFGYELAYIVHDGLKRMYENKEGVFYYITCMNENYVHPGMPEGAEEGILRGMYRLREGGRGKIRIQLLGSGTILREVIAAADLLNKDFKVNSDVWSIATNQLCKFERHTFWQGKRGCTARAITSPSWRRWG